MAIFRRGAFFGRSSMAERSRNAFPGVRQWRDIAAVRSRAVGHGSISPRCVFGGPAVARSRRDAFPGGDPWRLFHFMRSRRGLGREKRQFVARYRRHASETSRLWQDMRAMHPKSPANSRLGIHRAKILPGRGPFRCACPSDHARRADLAVVRRSPGAGPYAWKVGAGSRNRTPYCCRRSRVPARHLVAFCGGSLSRSERLALRHAALAVTIPRCDRPILQPTPRPRRDRPRPALFRPAAASHDPAHKKRPAFAGRFLRGYELSADYSARSFRRRSSSSASWWRLTLPDSVIGMASMNSMCSGRRRLATPMESRYSAMESSVGSTSPV